MGNLQKIVGSGSPWRQLNRTAEHARGNAGFRESNCQWSGFGCAANLDSDRLGHINIGITRGVDHCDAGRLCGPVNSLFKIDERRPANGFVHIQAAAGDGFSCKRSCGNGTVEDSGTNGRSGDAPGLSRCEESNSTGDMRCRHGGTVVAGVAADGDGGGDRRPRCTDINRGGAVTGEA